jgi:predicted nucleic acid-binding Zn ribbon protein
MKICSEQAMIYRTRERERERNLFFIWSIIHAYDT